MNDPFLERMLDDLNGRLAGQGLDVSVSLRVAETGNILISGQVAEISDARADCAVIGDADTFAAVMDGTLSPMKAVMFGKLKIAGDAGAAMKFGGLFG